MLSFHKPVDKQRLVTALRQIYPENWNMTFECCMQRTGIPFLDLYIISLSPLRTAVYSKGTHSCTYMPWSANLPVATKTGWIAGECVRYLRICSEELFYLLAWRRLRAALAFWGYPRRLWLPAPPVEWRHKSSVMTIKRHQISDEGIEGMGRVGLGLFPSEFLYCVHRTTAALHCLGLKLFHAFSPVFHTCLGPDFLPH